MELNSTGINKKDVIKTSNIAAKEASAEAKVDGSIFFSNTCKKDQPCIAVIDDFKTKAIDLDKDGVGDMTHGDAVVAFAKSTNPNAGFMLYNASADKNYSSQGFTDSKKVNSSLQNIQHQVDNGTEVDAVNMSFGQFRDMGFDLKGQKAVGVFRDQMVANPQDRKRLIGETLSDSIEKINELADKGVPVYIVAGNNGSRSLNLYSLSKGISVGATESWSANNVLVAKKRSGEFPVSALGTNKLGEVCYDFTGDKKADKCLPSSKKLNEGYEYFKGFNDTQGVQSRNIMFGTSFTTPIIATSEATQKFKEKS